MKWKKRVIVAVIIITVCFIISLGTYFVDSKRIVNDKIPIFILHTDHLDDGGTTVYYGFGYQLIHWKRLTEITNQYLTGIETHYLFGWNNPLNDPKIELKVESDAS